jgi:peptidyl-prolyl cis-trans isomerase A (cyclophilin A)
MARPSKPATDPSMSHFEALEQRLALFQGPMINQPPPFASLEQVSDTVVRVLTNVGRFDIELFDTVAPNTVQNFLNYVTSGRYDESFFHRSVGTILQGGGYKFDDGVGLSSIPADPPIVNEFSRSNLVRTIAMAKVANQPNSATSQFFINTADNLPLNVENGGYTVFGKIVQGWDVVQTIASYNFRDLDSAFTGSNPNPGVFDNVPVTPAYNQNNGPTEATIVKILDIEIIKARNSGKYYEQAYIFPEGFRSSTTTERIDLVNLDENWPSLYQIIVRYENGSRDQVIASGTIPAAARRSLKVNDFATPNYNLVRSGVGYAFEVRATRALAVSIDRRDNGVTIGEEFQMTARIATAALQRWNFGGGEKNSLTQSFLVYESLTQTNITVNIGIYPENGQPRFISKPLESFRRGGLAIHTLGSLIPDGAFSIQVSATGPIVAALSQYKRGGPSSLSEGFTSIGVMNSGATEGYLAAGIIPQGGSAQIELLYTAGSPAAISVNFFFHTNAGGAPVTRTVLLTTANRRHSYDLASWVPELATDQFFSVRYEVQNSAAPVAVNYRSRLTGDEMSTPFQTNTTRDVAFADGYTNPSEVPTQMNETISVFNPYQNNVNFLYQVFFRFSDGTILATNTLSLNPLARQDINPQSLPAVLAKINSNPAFRFYSIQIKTAQFSLPIVTGGVVAQITRRHNVWGQSYTSIPSLDARLPVLPLSHPEFD